MSGTVTNAAYVYGMCTDRSNTATRVKLLRLGSCTESNYNSGSGSCVNGNEYTSLSIPDYTRSGTWGQTTGLPVTLNLDQFKSESKEADCPEGGKCYEMRADLWRCHSGNESNCSFQPQTITVRVPSPDGPVFSAVSNAAANPIGSGENSWVTTGITNESATVNANTLNVNVGTEVEIRFSHNLYSSIKVTENQAWTAARNFGTLLTLTDGSGQSSGSTQFTGKVDNLYIADKRDYSDGANRYVLREIYKKKFDTAGYYNFCESITVGSVTTTACVSVNVGNAPVPEPDPVNVCDVVTPSSYTASNASSGTTSVASRVRNLSLSNSYRNYQNAVYAKPTDTVNWCNAYYPGVQYAYNATVTHENNHPEPREGLWYSNPLNNHTFSQYSDWTNQYNIDSHNVSPYFSAFNSYTAGMADIKHTTNDDRIEIGQAGQTLWETITSGFPANVSADSGESHTWGCHRRCDSDICGEHCCASHTECSGEGESRSCTRVCDAYCCNYCYVDTCYHDN